MNKLRIAISSGGTDVPIDRVRCISNFSSGTTGALTAESALNRGHSVDFIHSKGSKQPFQAGLQIDPSTEDLDAEMVRARVAAEHYQAVRDNLNEIEVSDFNAYQAELLSTVADKNVDAVVLAMAASDYGPKPVDGKISSDKEVLTIELQRLPKIISQIKQTRKGIFLVGFKFLVGVSDDELIATALKSMKRDSQDLAVANVANEVDRIDEARTFLVTPDGSSIPIEHRTDLAPQLIKKIETLIAA